MTKPVSATDLRVSALIPFLAIAFGLAWGLFALFALWPGWITQTFGPLSGRHPLFVLAVYAPAIAAFSLVVTKQGLDGLKRFLGRLLLWRAPAIWWAFLIAGIPLIYIIGSALKGNLSAYALPFDTFGATLGAIGFMLILGPMEEFGWRGVALPLLQRKFLPFWASVVLGLIWGLWHLPAFLLSGTPQSAWDFTPFVLGAVSISVILTPLFNTGGGSILLAMLFHFQLNNPLWPDAQLNDTAVFVTAAALVTFLNRKAMFSQGTAVTSVIPRNEP